MIRKIIRKWLEGGIVMNILETKDLKKYYGTGDNQVKALDKEL